MATPKLQNAYRDATNQTADIADLLLVTTSGLATDADAGASYLVYHNGSNDVLASSAAPFPVTISGVSTASLQTSGNASLTAIAASVAGTLTVSGAVTVSGVATAANQATEIASLASIDGKTPALGQALAAASVPIVLTAAQLSTLTPPAAISGFATETTLAALNTKVTAVNTGAVVLAAGTASIGKLAANSGVDIGDVTIDNAAGAAAVNIQDGGNSITVDGTFWQATQPVSGSVAVSSVSGTVTLSDLSAYTLGQVNAVSEVQSIVPGTTSTQLGKAEDQAHASGHVGVMALAVRTDTPANRSGTDGDYEPPQISAGRLWTSATVTAGTIDTVTNIAQMAGAAIAMGTGVRTAGTQRVTIATDDVLGTVTTVTTCSTVTTLTGGGVAHDEVDSGNPIKTGSRVALTLSDDTMVANADRADNVSDGDGTLLVRNQFPLADLVSETVTNTNGTSTAFSNFGATASTRNVITAIVAYNSSATAGTIDFRDGTAGSVLYTVPIPAGGGCILPAGATPYFKTTANTALAYDVSGALTTVTISISGFRSKVT